MKENNFLLYTVTFVICLAVINVGIIYGWPMSAIPKLTSGEWVIKVKTDETAWLASLTYLGAIIGSCIAIPGVQKFGSKKVILAYFVPVIIGWVLIGIATTFWELILAQMILGVAASTIYTVSDLYIAEISTPRVRGFLSGLCSISKNIGLLLTFGVGPYYSISQMAWLSLILPILSAVMFMWAPESPYWYARTNRFEELQHSLITLRGAENVQVEFEHIMKLFGPDKTPGESTFSWRLWKKLLSRHVNRRSITIVLIVIIGQQLSGITAVNTYAHSIFKKSDSIIPARYVALVIGCIELGCTFLSIMIVDTIGRRPLLLVSTVGTAICMAVMGLYYHMESMGYDLESINLLPLISILLFTIIYGLGQSCVSTVIMSDCLLMDLRSFGTIIINLPFCLSSMIVIKLWQVVTDSFGKQYAFGGTALATAMMLIVYAYIIPETKGKTLDEIEEILAGGRSTAKTQNEIPLSEQFDCSEEGLAMIPIVIGPDNHDDHQKS